jgi:aspartyl-tRNA(Asn)/glutamyl-tRNA(Gln) amidotransferase subunit A
MMAQLQELSALELAHAIATGETSSVAATQAALAQIDRLNGTLNAFLHTTPELALDMARQVDARRQAGEPLGPLAGVPIAIKDNISVTGTPTTCGSKILNGYVAPYDATVIERLKHQGTPILGKTNLDEFAMGSSTENSAYGTSLNPWDITRVPGGSSGGSAVAVAAGMAPLSLGSDTGGSVRQPAALCALVGLKPTYGLVSRFGLVAYASSLDQISPFTRTVEDTAALLETLAGYDPQDNTSAYTVQPGQSYLNALKTPPTGKLRVGVITELNGEGMNAEVVASFNQAIDTLKTQCNAEIIPISVTAIKEAIAAYYVIAPAEASSNLARFDGIRYGHRTAQPVDNVYDLFRKTRAEGFGPEVKRRIMLGTFVLSAGYYDAYYGKAMKARQLLKQSFEAAFEQVDVLICPTSPTTAFEIGAKSDDPIAMYLSDVATIPVNLAGIPAISVPCGFDGAGLPIGLQIMAPKWAEQHLLQVAYQYQEASGYKNLLPPMVKSPGLVEA